MQFPRISVFAAAVSLISFFAVASAMAVPAFTEQTGQVCAACHVGGFGPQLTPFGRDFKLSGYTLRASPEFTLPLSAIAIADFVHTQKDQSPPAPDFGTNNNPTIDQIILSKRPMKHVQLMRDY